MIPMSAGSMEDEKLSVEDIILSLTGFDEIAIEKAFKADLEDLKAQRQMRAMAFIVYRREGKTDHEAYEAAMGSSQKDVLEMFGMDIDEVMADEPETPAGKDDSQPELPLNI